MRSGSGASCVLEVVRFVCIAIGRCWYGGRLGGGSACTQEWRLTVSVRAVIITI